MAAGTISGVEAGDAFYAGGKFSIALTGTWTGTVKLQRKLNDVWQTVTKDGAEIAWTANMSEVVDEPDTDVEYRFNVTALSSGDVDWYAGGRI